MVGGWAVDEGERDVDVLVAGWKGGGEVVSDIEYFASMLERSVRLVVCVFRSSNEESRIRS